MNKILKKGENEATQPRRRYVPCHCACTGSLSYNPHDLTVHPSPPGVISDNRGLKLGEAPDGWVRVQYVQSSASLRDARVDKSHNVNNKVCVSSSYLLPFLQLTHGHCSSGFEGGWTEADTFSETLP